jgi:hypothetical protein
MKQEIEIIKKKVMPILKKNKVTKAGIFGSYARGEQNENSDIDILVEVQGSLLDLVELEFELEKVLNKKVDLLSYGGISKYMKDIILSEEVRIV